MAVSISYDGKSAVLEFLTVQHFGFETLDAPAGLAARKWSVAGLCTPQAWQDVLDVFTAWRTDRMADPDSKASGSIGSCVVLTATGYTVAGGLQEWKAVPCWFLSAPVGESLGAYVSVTFEVVDAAQWLAAANVQLQKATERAYFGTWDLGSTTLNLLQPPYTYTDNPNLTRTAGGVHFITGALTATRLADLQGHTTATGWDGVRTWYESTIQQRPSAGQWYPVTPPATTAEPIHDIQNGLRVDIYTVSVTLAQVK